MPGRNLTPSTPRVTHAEVAIVGAGPQGLAAALHLLERRPSLARTGGIVVLDPSGCWLSAWSERFRRLGIDTLRSPGVHHPGTDAHGLSDWIAREGCRTGLPYDIPSAADFERYCARLVDEAGLGDAVSPCGVVDLRVGACGIELVLADGATMTSEHLVLAVDPAERRIPAWADRLVDAGDVVHSADIDLRAVEVDGQEVVIVGGGLTAGHLAVGTVAAGANVTIVSRRATRERMFDTDPGWLGPKELHDYRNLGDPVDRMRAALAARDGGSTPPWMARRLRSLAAEGALRQVEERTVHRARRAGASVALVLDGGEELRADAVWLATGTRPDVTAHPLTRALAAAAPTRIVEGVPVLDEDTLLWPGTNAHLMGRLAMIPLGPAAGNLWGSRVAATRLADAIAGSPPVIGPPR